MSPTTIESAGGATEDLARIAAALERAAGALVPGGAPAVVFEAPRNLEFGDFASNVAFSSPRARSARRNEIASDLIERAFADEPGLRARSPGRPPTGGFINIRWLARLLAAHDRRDLARRGRFRARRAAGERISLEFGSANPTGPLSSCKAARSRSATRSRSAALLPATTSSPSGSSTTPARRWTPLARSLYARYRQLARPSFRFPMTAIRANT